MKKNDLRILIISCIGIVFLFMSCTNNTKNYEPKELQTMDTNGLDCCHKEIICADTSIIEGFLNGSKINGMFNLIDNSDTSLTKAILIFKNEQKNKIGILCFDIKNKYSFCKLDLSSASFRFTDGCVSFGERYKVKSINDESSVLKLFKKPGHTMGYLSLKLYSSQRFENLPDSIILKNVRFCKNIKN